MSNSVIRSNFVTPPPPHILLKEPILNRDNPLSFMRQLQVLPRHGHREDLERLLKGPQNNLVFAMPT